MNADITHLMDSGCMLVASLLHNLLAAVCFGHISKSQPAFCNCAAQFGCAVWSGCVSVLYHKCAVNCRAVRFSRRSLRSSSYLTSLACSSHVTAALQPCICYNRSDMLQQLATVTTVRNRDNSSSNYIRSALPYFTFVGHKHPTHRRNITITLQLQQVY